MLAMILLKVSLGRPQHATRVFDMIEDFYVGDLVKKYWGQTFGIRYWGFVIGNFPGCLMMMVSLEDETMHSGAKGNTSTLQLQQLSDSAALSQECGQATSQFSLQSQTSNHDGIVSFQNGQVLMANQSTVGTGMIGQEVSASIDELLSILLPRLDKYRAMQLQSLCSKVKKGEVSEGSFIGHMTSIVGPELFRVAVHKLKACTNSNTALLKQNRVLPISGQQRKPQLSSPQMKQGYAAPMNLMDEFWMQSSNIGFTQPTSMSNSLVPSVTSSIGPENNPKAPFKRPLVGQKKPMGAPSSSPPPSSKKRKVSEAFLDQSIGQLNDVTAGINIMEEEEQLFSGSKAKDRVSECVEERMLRLITNLIRLSKQRVDIEKPSHRTIITSGVRQQIMSINCKAQQEWERKQARTEDSQKLNESTNGVDDDKVKSESRRVRKAKADKEKDDNLRANIAVRAATGVDDMLSKWKGIIEANQKQEKNNKSRENQKAEKGDSSASLNTPGMLALQ
ncbi:hypothetical protein BUALT_Bualt08G0042300 [Buddleja alternifolia]|uniref:RST domain-containing protein n=1 Tax=Buddleja alternifolia TaxID=168488 RepID=A0AAV6XEJ0_9LAMI|nr:hypothetical protein BUALT_Bualt08G0042300 [Buddleja alternifolia]